MIQTSLKIGSFILFVLVFFAACSNNGEERNDEESTVNRSVVSEDNHINLVVEEDLDRVNVYIGGELFTSYLYTDEYKKPILYPLITAHGSAVTRGFPIDPRPGEQEDHPHQVGLWLNYGDVNGLDFWNNSSARPVERRGEYGTIFHKSINRIESGDEAAELEVIKEWKNSEGEILLTENTTYIFREDGTTRFVDRITTLQAPGQDVSLKDNKEGMIGIRVARELEHPDQHRDATGLYKSSEGLEGHGVWGTRARWMNLSGRLDGELVSVAILDHPDNVGYPTYWHARGYGLFAANPLGMKEMSEGREELNFMLPAGDSLHFRYRIIIYSGETVLDEQVESDWEEFTN